MPPCPASARALLAGASGRASPQAPRRMTRALRASRSIHGDGHASALEIVAGRRFPRWVMWCGMLGATTRAIRAMGPAYSSPTLDQEFSMVSQEFTSFSRWPTNVSDQRAQTSGRKPASKRSATSQGWNSTSSRRPRASPKLCPHRLDESRQLGCHWFSAWRNNAVNAA